MRSAAKQPLRQNDDALRPARRFSVALTEATHAIASSALLHDDGEEDVVFGLYRPSVGAERTTSLVHTIVLPIAGDRERHGNASFNPAYVDRAATAARSMNSGVVLLHSHLGPGWQSMSHDDIVAERRWSPFIEAASGLPLVGMTAGTDGAWSARKWEFDPSRRRYQRQWADNVRVVGRRLTTTWCNNSVPRPQFRECFKRTATVWGSDSHGDMARLRVGIVGLGSVGMMVAEILARMGMTDFLLIDFDEVQTHNLDRLTGASLRDVGKLKVDIAKRLIRKAATAEKVRIDSVVASVVEDQGYDEALDCDVLFSCVDRSWPRSVLNHIAYSHGIPVIDGGVAIRFRDDVCTGFDWQVQTVGPARVCLDCLNAFNAGDVGLEMEGKLDDPTYMIGLPRDHRLRRNENVFPISTNVASLETLQFVALATGVAQLDDVGVQRMRWMPGIMDARHLSCRNNCDFQRLVMTADEVIRPTGTDRAAGDARVRQRV